MSKFKPQGIFKTFCWNMKGREELIIPAKKLTIEECFNLLGLEKWQDISKNITVDEGLNDILGVYFKSGSATATWYLGLKGTNQTPASGWNAAGIGTQFTEFTSYTEGTREEWVEGSVSAKSLSNTASPAEFNINGSGTVYGAFIVSTNTKSGTTGIMWCCSDFGVSRPVVSGDLLKVVYSITSSDV